MDAAADRIGGDPARVLRRARELLAPDGVAIVEFAPAGTGSIVRPAHSNRATAPGTPCDGRGRASIAPRAGRGRRAPRGRLGHGLGTADLLAGAVLSARGARNRRAGAGGSTLWT
ncbi:hypothetical protein [Nocardia sp. NPDC059228]|uniref:hypothetical protein n=1 Tax=Nocardia sp. NPDC059228 TaxID=3346777 RepID=UPI0036C0381A